MIDKPIPLSIVDEYFDPLQNPLDEDGDDDGD